jgi:radical SAM superfamily enzyme YgiQ (UPF0313 family)
MRVALVNTNRMRPPIAPIGLDYVAEALQAAGHEPVVLDLCWAMHWPRAVERYFADEHYGLIGISLRNTDDCAFSSRQSFLGEYARMVEAIREHTDEPIILGGVGFSTMPEQVLEICAADAGVWGEGEFAFPALAGALAARRDWRDVPGLVWRDGDGPRRNPPSYGDLASLPAMTRSFLDNRRYFTEGGQAGFETKRGCSGRCSYCADPVAKGRQVRMRPPAAVADELAALLAQDSDHLHTCDSEFNLPAEHAAAVCEEIMRRGLGERLRWWAYCAPAPFSRELAGLMRRAGCAGINFGTDSGDVEMLQRLRREFGPEDIANAARWCREAGIVTMFDLLLGAPGETEASLTRTLELMQRVAADRVGVSLGVRIYPGTELAAQVARGELAEGLTEGDGLFAPRFFLEPRLAEGAAALIDRLTAGDPRFLFFDPSRPRSNYNYNANARLVEAISQGCRGAYWDILRRYEEGATNGSVT